MTSERQRALDAVSVGDVIYGISGHRNEKLLLVYEADEQGFRAVHITSRSRAEFDRHGRTRHGVGDGSCRIVSTAVLPEDDYKVAIGLDQKMRTGKAYPDFVLSKAEIQLILNYGTFFRANLLPEE